MGVLRTESGDVLTEEMIEAMAREAEAGFDPATIRPSRSGRPSLGEGTSPRVQFRVDAGTYRALLARARAEERGVSEIARIALEQYPATPVGTELVSGTLLELAQAVL